jgi:hypothetical protein
MTPAGQGALAAMIDDAVAADPVRRELLEALKEVAHFYGDELCWCVLPSLIEYRGHDGGCQAARAAIAKAEGK